MFEKAVGWGVLLAPGVFLGWLGFGAGAIMLFYAIPVVLLALGDADDNDDNKTVAILIFALLGMLEACRHMPPYAG